ncbi:hypothetical protein, partial [Limimaricola cinnabarinus]
MTDDKTPAPSDPGHEASDAAPSASRPAPGPDSPPETDLGQAARAFWAALMRALGRGGRGIGRAAAGGLDRGGR